MSHTTQTDGAAGVSEEGNNQGGGQGGTVLADSHHARADVALTRRAIRNRWPLPEGMLDKVAKKINTLVDSTDDRVASQALRTAVEMNKQNITIDQEEDKNDRLDAGKATENVAHNVKYLKGVDGGAL